MTGKNNRARLKIAGRSGRKAGPLSAAALAVILLAGSSGRSEPQPAAPAEVIRVLFARRPDPARAPLFPPLRQYTGAPASEKTDIRLATDGKKLRLRIRAYDAHPEKLARQLTDAGIIPAIWKEDSFEIFLKPEADFPENRQFIISNTGRYVLNRNQHLEDGRYQRLPWPEPETKEIKIKVKRHRQGYDIELEAPLKSLGFPKPLEAGDRFFAKVIRNYRAHLSPEREVLQIRPARLLLGPEADPANNRIEGYSPLECAR